VDDGEKVALAKTALEQIYASVNATEYVVDVCAIDIRDGMIKINIQASARS
jgi:hypothetical protein